MKLKLICGVTHLDEISTSLLNCFFSKSFHFQHHFEMMQLILLFASLPDCSSSNSTSLGQKHTYTSIKETKASQMHIFLDIESVDVQSI
jgi:hypothetical protein